MKSELERLREACSILDESLANVAIYSLEYCEAQYDFDEQARLNCQAALYKARAIVLGKI